MVNKYNEMRVYISTRDIFPLEEEEEGEYGL